MSDYLELLQYLMYHPTALQSDYSRYHASLIAEAASRGHITCIIYGLPTNKWYLTSKGRSFVDTYGN